MQPNAEEIPREASVHGPSGESAGGDTSPPSEAPQSGMSILLNIFLYMILLPTGLLLLARFLIE